MKKNKKKQIIMYILLLFMFLGIGYAFLNTSLIIEGTSSFSANEWNVYIDENSIHVLPGSVSGNKVISAPSVSGDTISVSTRLTEPGDYFVFSFDVVNDGSIDAMIGNTDVSSTTTSNDSISNFIFFSGSYISGAGISPNQRLNAHTRETIRLEIRYKNFHQLSPSTLPTEDQTITFHGTIRYVQADSRAQDVRGVVYRISEDELSIGDTMPLMENQKLSQYRGHVLNFSANNTVYAIRHEVDGSHVLDSGLVFTYENNEIPAFGEEREAVPGFQCETVFDDSQICTIASYSNSLMIFLDANNSYGKVGDYTGEWPTVDFNRYCEITYASGAYTTSCSGFSS